MAYRRLRYLNPLSFPNFQRLPYRCFLLLGFFLVTVGTIARAPRTHNWVVYNYGSSVSVRKALMIALFCLCETCDVYYYVPNGQMQHGINTMFTGGKSEFISDELGWFLKCEPNFSVLFLFIGLLLWIMEAQKEELAEVEQNISQNLTVEDGILFCHSAISSPELTTAFWTVKWILVLRHLQFLRFQVPKLIQLL